MPRSSAAPPDRAVAADMLLSYVTGFVLQEQADPASAPPAAGDLAALTARFPLTMGNGPAFDRDVMFARSLRLQYGALAHGQRG
ncbi:hypothetical protein ACIA8K_30830 [Catenuloplanes sp. NPDC051500]|uniref:hypothetical protein n=1 Tax=Catenuloplanes sp. NPDC051500 TaxID=3363959 RepID=UPI00379FE88A